MEIKNSLLQRYLDKRRKQGTVILCFKILLDHTIVNGRSAIMTKSEINKEFDKIHKEYGVGTFRSDYLLRQSSNSELNAIGVQNDNSTFFIRPEFIEGLNSSDLNEISSEIEEFYLEATKKHKALFTLIEDAFFLDLEGQKEFIIKMLLEIETDRKGQSFEVTAYAILKAFYRVRGFELNRFSTIYSNDGGIDFTSQMAVYQVTTNLSNRKFEDDIDKAPLKQRVFVYKNEGSGFDKSNFDNDLVLDFISSDDLKVHLNYLFEKKPKTNSKLILGIIKQEFEREYYL